MMTPKDIHKIFIPQKIFIFLKTLKGIEIQNFEPQNGASLRMNENIIVPPPSTLSSQIETGAGGVQTQITEKNSDKGVYCCFFLQLYYIFYGSKGSKHLSGGGGVQLFIIIIIFFLGGGGWGGTNPYFYRNLYNLWFFRGGGGPDHLSLSGFAHG